MVKASELRISNWVESLYGYFQIEDEDEFIAVAKLPENYKSIPLTPEILEAAGFKKSVDRFRLSFGEGGYGESWDLVWLEGDGLFMEVNEEFTKTANITHLHQLQNLYFALTGQELTLNLHAAV